MWSQKLSWVIWIFLALLWLNLGIFGHNFTKGPIDFRVMYHHDYSELEAVDDISNHLCILCDDFIEVPEVLFCFFGFLIALFMAAFGLF
jgi:hypothetical protein